MAQIELLQPTEKIKDSYGKINTSLTNLNNNKLEKSGGEMTGFADFANGTGVRGKKVDGSTVLIGAVNSLNQILLGEIGEATNIRGSAVLINDLPAWYAGNSPANFAPNGYQKLASGLIIQWGEATVPPNVLTPFVFPVAYTTFVIAIPVIDHHYPYAVSTAGVSTTGFNAVHTAPSDMTVRYIAVGW